MIMEGYDNTSERYVAHWNDVFAWWDRPWRRDIPETPISYRR